MSAQIVTGTPEASVVLWADHDLPREFKKVVDRAANLTMRPGGIPSPFDRFRELNDLYYRERNQA